MQYADCSVRWGEGGHDAVVTGLRHIARLQGHAGTASACTGSLGKQREHAGGCDLTRFLRGLQLLAAHTRKQRVTLHERRTRQQAIRGIPFNTMAAVNNETRRNSGVLPDTELHWPQIVGIGTRQRPRRCKLPALPSSSTTPLPPCERPQSRNAASRPDVCHQTWQQRPVSTCELPTVPLPRQRPGGTEPAATSA